MSKDVDWGPMHGAGDIVCTCDNCYAEERYPFEEREVDYRAAQAKLKEKHWISCKVKDEWYDFCCEECRNEFIKKYG